ncbi:MAG: class I SAM-dependent methyltransferase [Alphaproteobacteria bacterium]|nr:class I SAM-dependent methyltransferase [Alphaproteobacteria bacterium]
MITEAIEDRLLFDLIGEVRGRAVLDVGCGEGALAIKLHEMGAAATGVDPSRDMLVAAQSRAESAQAAVGFARAAGERLPFATASFDVVLAKTVLCFVAEAQGMVDEMARVLRPGGRFVIGELHKWSSWAAQRRLRGWFGSALWRRGRFRTAEDLRRLAQEAGLEVETVRGAVYYPRSGTAARLMAPFDARIARLTTFGAAFLALAAVKPAVVMKTVSDTGAAALPLPANAP